MSINQSGFEGLIIFGKYKIIRKIGEGSFGICYEGIDTESGEKYAIKVEANDYKVRLITNEITFYKYILQDINGIPRIYSYGKERGINLMVLQLLGNNLYELFKSCNYRFSLKTIFMLAEQMIARIESIHSKYVIHRDIKPENFLMGFKDEEKKKLFLIDFGITKPFMDSVTKRHIPFKIGKSVTGTVRYCSLNSHNGYELSRRDDLESVAYILIYFIRGSLPWDVNNSQSKSEIFNIIKEKKSEITVKELCEGIPSIFGEFLSYCRKLGFEEKPNYHYWREKFLNQKFVHKIEWDFEFDWNKANDN